MATAVIKLKAKPGKRTALVEAMQKMVRACNANEAGIVFFQGFRSDTPDEFFMLESFKDMEARQTHQASEHFKTLRPELMEYVEGSPEILRLTLL